MITCAGLAACTAGPTYHPATLAGEPEALPAFEVAHDTWTYGSSTGRRITTPHYLIFTTEDHPVVLDRLPAFCELALHRYRTALSDLPEPGSPLETYVLGTRREWDKLTMQLTGKRASTYLRLDRGGYADKGRAVLYDIGTRDTFSIAAHEGWHQYVQAVFDDPLPVWLDEGIGAYMEGYRWAVDDPTTPVFLPWSNAERFDQLRRAYRAGRLLGLSELLSARPQDLVVRSSEETLDYYAQVWALVHFLEEGEGGRYREETARVLRDAASGELVRRITGEHGRDGARELARRRGTLVFESYFGDVMRIAPEYTAFVERVVTTAEKHRLIAGYSPITE